MLESPSLGREEPVFAGTATVRGRSQNRDSSGGEKGQGPSEIQDRE